MGKAKESGNKHDSMSSAIIIYINGVSWRIDMVTRFMGDNYFDLKRPYI